MGNFFWISHRLDRFCRRSFYLRFVLSNHMSLVIYGLGTKVTFLLIYCPNGSLQQYRYFVHTLHVFLWELGKHFGVYYEENCTEPLDRSDKNVHCSLKCFRGVLLYKQHPLYTYSVNNVSQTLSYQSPSHPSLFASSRN